jgi:hypothetical protein
LGATNHFDKNTTTHRTSQARFDFLIHRRWTIVHRETMASFLSAAPQRKNPPRIAADGFWAQQITLNKTPPLTGPVKRGSFFLSTGGAQLRIGE